MSYDAGLMSKDKINAAWNLVEAWTCGRELPVDVDDDNNKEANAPEGTAR